jgi:lysozyme family protein
MANYKVLVPFIQKWEGGFANDPLDAGGATMIGVTIGTYTDYRRKKGLPAPTVDELNLITPQEWMDIFKTLYWDRWQADKILSQSVANILVDWVWGSGAWGIKIPQRILGVAEDGIVGPKTLIALNARISRQLFAEIRQARVKYIDDIIRRTPTNERFRRGWMNRLDDLKFTT